MVFSAKIGGKWGVGVEDGGLGAGVRG